MAPTSPSPALTAAEFLSSVLALRPRVAVFDCDGTLWAGNSGEEFLDWEIAHGLLAKDLAEWVVARYREYKAGQVAEDVMCGEMVQIHRGLDVGRLERAAAEFFAERFARRIFPEMAELVRRLTAEGCELWAVSSTNEWVVKAGTRRLGIADERVLAACVRCVEERATGDLIRVPTDQGKAAAIREVVGRAPDAVFGNSLHDFHMMEMARAAFAIGPNADLEQAARERGWTVYWPEPR